MSISTVRHVAAKAFRNGEGKTLKWHHSFPGSFLPFSIPYFFFISPFFFQFFSAFADHRTSRSSAVTRAKVTGWVQRQSPNTLFTSFFLLFLIFYFYLIFFCSSHRGGGYTLISGVSRASRRGHVPPQRPRAAGRSEGKVEFSDAPVTPRNAEEAGVRWRALRRFHLYGNTHVPAQRH